MVKKKGKSKRQTLKDAYKIKKRTKEHHRKVKKQAKKDLAAGIVRNSHISKKDPGIPNAWPFKGQILKEIQQQKQREKLLGNNKGKLLDEHQMAEMMAKSEARREKFEISVQQQMGITSTTANKDNNQSYGQSSRRAYLRELKKVVDTSDVILQVLDARDPQGSRAWAVEDMILSNPDKRMVLLLNKVDLVPKQAVSGWLNYLRRSHPTIAMKAATNMSSHADLKTQAKGENALKGSAAVGVEGLLQLLKNYARASFSGQKDKKTCITVGIIGYPNVGKSSIINSLKRARSVGVSPKAGFTNCAQEVVLDKNIRLVDSPGVVFDDTAKTDGSGSLHVLLRNCVAEGEIVDPLPAIKCLIQKCSQQSLMMTYAIPAFPLNDENIFLAMVAKKLGKILKGGVPDKVAAAKHVLRDWNNGTVPFYTPPPQASDLSNRQNDAVIVGSFSKEEFDVSKMQVHDDEVMQGLNDDDMDFVALTNNYNNNQDNMRTAQGLEKINPFENLDSDEDMEEDSDDDDEMDHEQIVQQNAALADAEDFDFGAV